jgi:hypothetical protein
MLDISQFRNCIVKPALRLLNLYSKDAEELLVATCAQESLGGTYLCQVGGPAVGIYQMEPATHDDLWHTILANDQTARWAVMKAMNTAMIPKADRMLWDMYYATFMARVLYLRIKDPLPSADDIDALWDYYKRHWNTEIGAARKTDFIVNYNKFVSKKQTKE